MLQRPGQDALAELGHLLAVLEHDGVLADQVDAAHVAVEVDTDAGPVEAGRHLLDMGRLAGAVIALDDHPPIEREAGQNGHRGVMVETVGFVQIGNVLAPATEGGHHHVGVDAEGLAHRNLDVRQRERVVGGAGEVSVTVMNANIRIEGGGGAADDYAVSIATRVL